MNVILLHDPDNRLTPERITTNVVLIDGTGTLMLPVYETNPQILR